MADERFAAEGGAAAGPSSPPHPPSSSADVSSTEVRRQEPARSPAAYGGQVGPVSSSGASTSGAVTAAPTAAHSDNAEQGDVNHARRRKKQKPVGRVNRGAAGLNSLGLDNAQGSEKAASEQEQRSESNGGDEPAFPEFAGDLAWSQRTWLYELMPFRGMWYDVRRRLPYYGSDWTEAFHPRNWWTVAQAVVRIYFINLMPAIAYVLDMYHRTNGAYGVNEVILASALAAIVFPIFSVQPLTFVGVTGLINLVSTAIKVTHWKAKVVPRLIAASGSCTLLSPKSAFVAFRCVVEVVGRLQRRESTSLLARHLRHGSSDQSSTGWGCIDVQPASSRGRGQAEGGLASCLDSPPRPERPLPAPFEDIRRAHTPPTLLFSLCHLILISNLFYSFIVTRAQVNYTQYDIVVEYYGLSQMDYLRVQAWSLIWAAGFHFIAAIFNLCDFSRFITDMTSTTFGFYVGIVYIQKGIELLILEYEPAPLDNATGWLSVTIASLFVVSVYLVSAIGRTSYLPYRARTFIASFAFAAGCIFWTGFSHFPKNSLERVPIERLPITRSFFPTMDRSWFIDFWNIEAKWAFVGAPLGFLITLLFWFDHNVSSIMAQARQFPVKRPAGFHWDFFLLGITTLVSGFLGLPAPNGLVPQCPWHTEALSVFKQVKLPKEDEDEESKGEGKNKSNRYAGKVRKQPSVPAREHIVNTRVVEQRASHLLIGGITLATMTRPFLVALGTMPRAVFAGIFLLVGWGSIEGNIITTRTLAVFRDRALAPADDPLNQIRRSKIALFVAIQWFFFAITFAISQTIAGIGFPVLITLLIPFRYWVVPKWFSPLELRVLDAPTADANVVMASIGHESERCTGQGVKIAEDTKIAGTEYYDDENSYSDSDSEDDDAIQPYSIGAEDEQRQRAERASSPPTKKAAPRASPPNQHRRQSSVPAVQESPFGATHTMTFLDGPAVAFLNAPAEGQTKHKRRSIISRILGRSNDAGQASHTATGTSSTSSAVAADMPAVPKSKADSNLISGHPAARDTAEYAKEQEELAHPKPSTISLSGAPAAREVSEHTSPSSADPVKDKSDATVPSQAAAPAAAAATKSSTAAKPEESAVPAGALATGGAAAGGAGIAAAALKQSKTDEGPAAAPAAAPAPTSAAQSGSTTKEAAQPTAAKDVAQPAPALPSVAAASTASQPAAGNTNTAQPQAADPAVTTSTSANDGKTTAEIAAAAGVAGGTAAAGLAMAAGKKQATDVEKAEAQRQAAAETLAKAEERKKALDEEKKNKRSNSVRVKEEKALEKKRAAEAKKQLKEAEKQKKEAEKESRRQAVLAAQKNKREKEEQDRKDAEAAKRKKREDEEAAKKKKKDDEEAAKKRKKEEAAAAAAAASAAAAAEKAKKDQEAADKKKRDEEAKKLKEATAAREKEEKAAADAHKEAEKAKKEAEAATKKQKEDEAKAKKATDAAHKKQETEEKHTKEATEKRKAEEAAAAAAAGATAAAVAELEREKKKREEAEEARKAAEKAQHDAEEQSKREAEAKAKREAEEKKEQEAQAKAKQEAEAKAQKEADERKKKEEAEAAAAAAAAAAALKKKDEEVAAAKAQLEEEHKARLAAEKQAQENAAALQAKLDEEHKAREAAEKKAKEDAKAAQAKFDEEHKAREASEKKGKAEAAAAAAALEKEHKAREKAEKKAEDDAAKAKAKLDKEHKAREEAEKKAKDDAKAAKSKLDDEHKAREDGEKKSKAEAAAAAAAAAASLEKEHKARIDAEKKAEDDAKAAKASLDEEHKAREKAEAEAKAEHQKRLDAEEQARSSKSIGGDDSASAVTKPTRQQEEHDAELAGLAATAAAVVGSHEAGKSDSSASVDAKKADAMWKDAAGEESSATRGDAVNSGAAAPATAAAMQKTPSKDKDKDKDSHSGTGFLKRIFTTRRASTKSAHEDAAAHSSAKDKEAAPALPTKQTSKAERKPSVSKKDISAPITQESIAAPADKDASTKERPASFVKTGGRKLFANEPSLISRQSSTSVKSSPKDKGKGKAKEEASVAAVAASAKTSEDDKEVPSAAAAATPAAQETPAGAASPKKSASTAPAPAPAVDLEQSSKPTRNTSTKSAVKRSSSSSKKPTSSGGESDVPTPAKRPADLSKQSRFSSIFTSGLGLSTGGYAAHQKKGDSPKESASGSKEADKSSSSPAAASPVQSAASPRKSTQSQRRSRDVATGSAAAPTSSSASPPASSAGGATKKEREKKSADDGLTREIEEDGKKFIEHINPRFANLAKEQAATSSKGKKGKKTGSGTPAKTAAAVQWRS